MMGVDRHLIAKKDIKKGDVIATIGRAYRYEDPLEDDEVIIEFMRAIRAYDRDFDECIDLGNALIDALEWRGRTDLVDEIVEDGMVEVVDA